MRKGLPLLLALAALLAAIPAAADLRSADEKFLHGDYAAAIKEYRAIKGRDAGRAKVRLGRALLRTGDHAGAEAAAKLGAKDKDKKVAADAQVLLGEVHRATGRYADARKTLLALVKAHPDHLRGRVQLGLTYRDLGENDLAERIWNSFYDDWSAGKIDQQDGEQLMYVAIAARYLEGFEDSNDTFRDAVNQDPNLLEANIEWGWLFLDKYAAGYAEQSFDEVLKVDPSHPDAHAGMARVKLEQNYDYRSAGEHIEKALAQNPRHSAALAIRAELEIDNAEWDDAKKTLGLILAVNPNDLVAHSMLAAIAYLRDDQAAFEAAKKKVFSVNPKFARFYHIVADFAVKAHRYREAIALEEEALKLDPRYHVALEAIGTGYLRLGDEKKGLEYLNKAWERDSFNVRTYNILNLFEDVIPRDYVFTQSTHFRFRMLKSEQKVLERYVPRLMERAYGDMARRYGFQPKAPVTIELFGDPDHYSVRTVGLPNLGALGVCFGQVITALSPSNGNLNWGMILWHELGHVFAIQLSNSRVPRWFTEGLSEYETVMARPEWRRENDGDVWLALDRGALPSIVELNSRFLRARDMGEMVVAYHMSSLAVEFLATRWGFPKIVEALKLYGKGKDDREVIQAVTGLDVPAFDAEFRAWLEKRLAAYKGTFKVRPAEYLDLAALEKAAAARPDDAAAHADLAIGYLVAQEADKARASAAEALKREPQNRKALWVVAELAFGGEKWPAARAAYEALIAAGGDGYDARMRLAAIALRSNDLGELEAQLTRAKKLDPERSEPYLLLAEQYAKQGRDADALKELEKYVLIEQMEYGPAKKVVDRYVAQKAWAKVREYGEIAVMINPYDPDLHVALATAYEELGRHDDAIYEYESALVCDPPLRRPAVAHLGLARTWLAKKDMKRAKQALEAALKLEPQNAEALALKKKIR